jgi:hypothetical protein
MSQSILSFIRRSGEFIERGNWSRLPQGVRGIYVLYRGYVERGMARYDVLYIGMSRGQKGVRSRLRSHTRSKRKGKWTHYSVFEVWSNITDQEIEELEGFARHIYRHDPTASTLNIQRGYKKLRKVREKKISKIAGWN